MSAVEITHEAVAEVAGRMFDGDLVRQPQRVQDRVQRDARAALEAALPYLTPQPVASREAVRSLIGAASPDLAAYPDRLDYVTDAVLALLNGTES